MILIGLVEEQTHTAVCGYPDDACGVAVYTRAVLLDSYGRLWQTPIISQGGNFSSVYARDAREEIREGWALLEKYCPELQGVDEGTLQARYPLLAVEGIHDQGWGDQGPFRLPLLEDFEREQAGGWIPDFFSEVWGRTEEYLEGLLGFLFNMSPKGS